ncbi:MAG: carboxypeptidase regulatory-like domain-containing protein [Planctomycetes bacterium]|nr:carboxypeptidase regulatory-like domain-containing protein [Planctomycetota bacterium]
MKRAFPVLLCVALLVVGVVWWNGRAPPPRVGAPNEAATSQANGDGTSELPAAALADPAAQREATAPPIASGELEPARHVLRGKVAWAADGRAAAGARVRAHRGDAPLTRQVVAEELARARTRSAPPASEHDLGGSGELPWPRQDDAADAVPEELGDDPDAAAPPTPSTVAEAICAADGTFELRLGETRRVTIDAVADLGRCAEPRVVDLAKEAAPGPIELLLVDGAAVRGRVIDGAGAPIAGARVLAATRFDPFAIFAAAGMEVRTPAEAITDGDGRFALDGIEPGLELQLSARARGYAPSATQKVLAAPGAPTTVELRLLRGARLVVTLQGPDGAPYPDATCRLDPSDLKLDELSAGNDAMRGTRRRTDRAGQATFSGLAPGRYRARVDVAPFVEARADVVVAPDSQELTATLLLTHGRELRGRVAAKDGTPIAGAHVSATEPTSLANVMKAATGAGRRFAEADAEGRFTLTGLPHAKLEVAARAKGYEEAKVTIDAEATEVELALATRGALEGIVLSRVTGKPLRAYVLLLERRAQESASMFDASAFAGMQEQRLAIASENGKFRLTGVAPGELRLGVVADGHGEWRGEWLRLEEGATKRGIIVSLAAEAVVTGRVVAADGGRPLAGATLQRNRADQALLQQMVSRMLQSPEASCDADGRFRVGGLPAGSHRFTVRCAGFVDGALPPVTLAAGEQSADLLVELEAGATIWGVVRGSDGAPVAGASIMCQDLARMAMQSVRSDASGTYRIEGLAAGNFALTRMPAELALGGDDFMKEMQGQIETQNVRLKAGEELRVDFGMRAKGTARLVGKVTSGGRPYAGAMVQVIGSGSEGGSGGIAAGTVESDGTFVFESLRAGRAFVQVHGADFAAGEMNAALVPVLLKDGATSEVAIDVPAGSLVGTVVDAESGAPLAGIAVYLAIADDGDAAHPLELAMRRTMAARTDAAGRFTVPRVPPGRCRVVAGGSDLLSTAAREHAITALATEAPASGARDVGVIRLPRAARIAGTLVDAAGKPIANGSLFLRNPATGRYLEEWSSVSSGDDGSFEYSGVPDGSWDVVGRAPGYASAAARGVRAVAGSTATVRLELIGGTEVFALLGNLDFGDLSTLSLTVDGPDGPLPLTLFGLGELADALSAPWQQDVVRLGRFGPGTYRVHGSLRGKPIDHSITLKGEPELRVPISIE